MKHVYLIGDGPASGKSTTADAISKKHGIERLKLDLLEGDHREKAADDAYPVNSYLNSLPEDMRPLELIRLSSKQEIARHEELFYMLLKELRERDFDKLIIEGNLLMPYLVKGHFEFEYSAVWIIPTLKFQSAQYMKREWAIELLQQSDDPTLLLHNWVQRDHMFNETILAQARQAGFPRLVVDGTKPETDTIAWAEKNLHLA